MEYNKYLLNQEEVVSKNREMAEILDNHMIYVDVIMEFGVWSF